MGNLEILEINFINLTFEEKGWDELILCVKYGLILYLDVVWKWSNSPIKQKIRELKTRWLDYEVI